MLCRDHDMHALLARTSNCSLLLDDMGDGLHFRAQLAEFTLADDTLAQVRAGLLAGMSIGFYVRNEAWNRRTRSADLAGHRACGDQRCWSCRRLWRHQHCGAGESFESHQHSRAPVPEPRRIMSYIRKREIEPEPPRDLTQVILDELRDAFEIMQILSLRLRQLEAQQHGDRPQTRRETES
jgi:hypothetical protein